MSRRQLAARTPGILVSRVPYDGPEAAQPGKEAVGSKAFNLMVMSRHGLPVPPGFVLGTDLCRAYMEHGRSALDGLEDVLAAELDRVGRLMGRRFGDARRPLLVSVRSGAAVSMPGMMETVLNVGLSGGALQGLIRLTGNPRLAYDCRRRLLQQFAEVVHGVPSAPFEALLSERLARNGLSQAHQLDSDALRDLAEATLTLVETVTGQPFPDEPLRQLMATVEAVLRSWSSPRARSYRALNGIDDNAGTAVIVQAMVFGNAGPSSGSGVGFTRSPADGANGLYIDYLPNAQGEDVVAGRRNALGAAELQHRVPKAYDELTGYCTVLERAFADMQDFEFTVEDGRLFMLQCRSGKRTPLAALRIAHDLVAEKLITPDVALARLDGIDVDGIETTELASDAPPLARGVPASAGVVVGAVVFDPTRLREIKARGEPAILLRETAETEDITAVSDADGLVTALGARTSHAAVVARQLAKVCLVGCASLKIDPSLRSCTLGGEAVNEGDLLSLDGGAGTIYRGAVPIRRQKPKELLAEVKRWRKHKCSAGPR